MRAMEDLLNDKTALIRHIRSALAARERRTLPTTGMRLSAVLVPLCWRDASPTVILTKRSMTVEHHKGETAFPGGHAEETDSGPEETALREAHEEIGLKPDDVEILGRLDDHFTLFGFHITPVVGVMPFPYPLRINSESESLVHLPLATALTDDAWMTDTAILRGVELDIFCIEAEEGFVWGATARMLKHFAEIILGRPITPGPMHAAAQEWIAGIIAAQKTYARKL